MPSFAEFFAGAGMVSAALRPAWDLALANDIDPRKCASYRQNWGADALVEGDIATLPAALLRRPIDLYWASSPCQDLSLAGRRRGLDGARSGVFFRWMDHVGTAVAAGFAPRILAFENVTGLITSRGGADLLAVADAFARHGYRFGALEIDAVHFLPQSRPRLFVIGVRDDVAVPGGLTCPAPSAPFHTARLAAFVRALPRPLARRWLWWSLPRPAATPASLKDLVEHPGGAFFAADKVAHIVGMMDPPSLQRLDEARRDGGHHIGTIYRRGRPDGNGAVRQRAELRLDGIAGCLRTPAGGSSRQTLVVIRDGEVGMRLLSAREALRLMGLPDGYLLPARYNDAYKLAGDGVAVPVVRHLGEHLFEPLLKAPQRRQAA